MVSASPGASSPKKRVRHPILSTSAIDASAAWKIWRPFRRVTESLIGPDYPAVLYSYLLCEASQVSRKLTFTDEQNTHRSAGWFLCLQNRSIFDALINPASKRLSHRLQTIAKLVKQSPNRRRTHLPARLDQSASEFRSTLARPSQR